MRHSAIFSAVLVVISFGVGRAQDKPFVYPQVHVPTAVWDRLVHIVNLEDHGKGTGVLVRNLSDPADLSYHDGIFTYTLPGPHFHRRLFFVQGKIVVICRDWMLKGILHDYLDFIKQAQPTRKTQATHLRAIATFVDEELEAWAE